MRLKEWQILKMWANGFPALIAGTPIKAEPVTQTHDDDHEKQDAEPVQSDAVELVGVQG